MCNNSTTSPQDWNKQFRIALETMRILGNHNKPRIDVFITTEEIWLCLKKYLSLRKMEDPATFALNLGGIPLEVYSSETEVFARGSKLQFEGKRIKLLLGYPGHV